jgi:hypothetical protein
MICEQCKLEGKTSTIQVGPTSSTCVYSPAFYDERGRLHQHDANSHTTQYVCSNGHHFSKTERYTCPLCEEEKNGS